MRRMWLAETRASALAKMLDAAGLCYANAGCGPVYGAREFSAMLATDSLIP